MPECVTLGLIQSSAAEDIEQNLEKNLRLVRTAAGRGARIICLPELYRSRYFPQASHRSVGHLAEGVPGPSTRAFSRLAAELKVVLILPIFERTKEGLLYNSAVVVDADGRRLGAYRKVHIPHDPLFYEQDYFRPGDLGFKVFRSRYADFSVLICFDQWFPEAARACALKGAQILFYPTAIGRIQGHVPREGDWRSAWITIQRSHAIANSVHVAAVNRVGREGRLRFWGSSFVSGPFGDILSQASQSREQVLLAQADLKENRRVREGWGFFRNRRPEDYSLLCSKARA